MKKILLATTMLASVAGYAAADVSVSGDARMGVVSAYVSALDKNETTFSSRMRIKFSGSGTTDGGLSFGGSFRAADASLASDPGTKGSTFISGAFGKISMGDVDGGDEVSVGQIDGAVGYTGLGSGNSIGYVSDGGFSLDSSFKDETSYSVKNADAAKVLYTYSVGSVTINASTAQLSNNANSQRSSYGIGASYAAGNLTVGLGYGQADLALDVPVIADINGSITDISASAAYTMGATTIKAIYQDKQLDVEDVSASAVSMGVSVKHTIDVIALTAYAISTKFEADMFPGESVSADRYGIGATYDLGGGAVLAAGWVHNEAVKVNGDDEIYSQGVDGFDAGVNFSF